MGAVQKLRDGPQAYETLAQLEGPKVEEGSNKYIDYHYEASEYEKKLIQVLIFTIACKTKSVSGG